MRNVLVPDGTRRERTDRDAAGQEADDGCEPQLGGDEAPDARVDEHEGNALNDSQFSVRLHS